LRLSKEKEVHTKFTPGGYGDTDNLRKQISAMHAEINEINLKMEQEGNSKIKNQAIFDQSKNYS
jgi:hypothetical protein